MLPLARRSCCGELTVLLVVLRLDLLLVAAVERVLDVPYRVGRREGTVQEVARARLLHDVGARVPAQLAEPVVAEDDRLVLHLGVGDHEVAIYDRQPTDDGTCVYRRKTLCCEFGHRHFLKWW